VSETCRAGSAAAMRSSRERSYFNLIPDFPGVSNSYVTVK
jgi:hypothetical protein